LALVLLKPEFVGQVNEHAVRNYAIHAIEASGISRYGVLLQVTFVKRLLKTSVGKMNKQGMRANPGALSENGLSPLGRPIFFLRFSCFRWRDRFRAGNISSRQSAPASLK
jgi:hypothetical protein